MPRWRVAPLVFRALLVFRAPEGPATVWLCCCVAPRVFRAPEGPAAVCAGGRRPAREPSALRASLGASSRSPARPRRRPPAPRQIPPAPSTPVGPGVLRSGLARCLAIRPGPASAQGCRRQALDPRRGLLVSQSFWGVRLRVVTNVVNRRCFSCGFLRCCYKRRQSDGFFAENQGFWTQIDDVCNMSTRKEVQTAPV